jgi:mRNA interferase MazF
MTTYELGEIVLVVFPQTDGTAKKKRPAVVILDVGDNDLVLAPITSRTRTGPGDIEVASWTEAGLLCGSWARLAKIACLDKWTVLRRLGRLVAGDLQELIRAWSKLYALTPRT